MGRTVYIVAPGTLITPAIVAAANGAEIAEGVPPRITDQFPNPSYPFTYTEPDDPEKTPVQQAINQLRNTFNTARTPTQVNNSIDALTILMRQAFKELKP